MTSHNRFKNLTFLILTILLMVTSFPINAITNEIKDYKVSNNIHDNKIYINNHEFFI